MQNADSFSEKGQEISFFPKRNSFEFSLLLRSMGENENFEHDPFQVFSSPSFFSFLKNMSCNNLSAI